MYEGVGDAIDGMFKLLLFLIVFAVPLALWKLIDIIIWLYKRVSIGLVAVAVCLGLSGCITMNNCHYCHESKHPEYVKHVYKDMGDGIRREIKWYGWQHYEKRIPQPDKTIELIEKP